MLLKYVHKENYKGVWRPRSAAGWFSLPRSVDHAEKGRVNCGSKVSLFLDCPMAEWGHESIGLSESRAKVSGSIA